MPSTNMMLPAESSLDSPKRSLLQEKVGCRARFQLSSASNSFYLFVDYHLSPECAPQILVCDHVFSNLVVFLLPTALATLKPQAGLVAPQAVPASQPAAAVSDWLLIPVYQILISNTTLSFFFHCSFSQSLFLLSLLQGAGGEPMEISEQVGMTPEIIQKVRFFPLICSNHDLTRLTIFLQV